MDKLKELIARPHVTEKSTILNSIGQYVFKVSCQETKKSIKQGIEKIYNVKVIAVNMIKMKGKTRRFGQITGRRKNWKKAYVTLADGQVIDLPNEQSKE